MLVLGFHLTKIVVLILHVARDAAATCRGVTRDVFQPKTVVVRPFDSPDRAIDVAGECGDLVVRLPAKRIILIVVDRTILVGHLNRLTLPIVLVADHPLSG